MTTLDMTLDLTANYNILLGHYLTVLIIKNMIYMTTTIIQYDAQNVSHCGGIDKKQYYCSPI